MLFVLWSFWPDLNRRPIDYEASKKSIIHIILYNFNFITTIYCGKSVANNFLTSLRHSFQPNNLPSFEDYARAERARQRAVRPRFLGLWPRKSSFSGTTERRISVPRRRRGGALCSLPGGALFFTRFAPWPSMTFAGRATDAALRHFRLSACAGLPAPHKITSRPPIGGAQRCTAPGKAPRAASAFRAARARGIRARSGLAAYFFL